MSKRNFYAVLGREDNYKLLPPFVKDDENEVLKIIDTGKLKEYVESDLNILKTVYEPNGLSKVDMEEDISLDSDLITLSNKKGFKIVVPSTYLTIEDVDKRTYVYNRRALVIDLGALSKQESLVNLIQGVKDVCIKNIGKLVNVKEVPLTTDVYLTDQEHEVKQADRLVTIGGAIDNMSRITQLEQALVNKQKEIDSLMCIIKKKL